MTQHTENLITIGKGIGMLAVSGVLYLAEASQVLLTDAPSWVERLGLSTAMLLIALGGLVFLFKAYKEANEARIRDRDIALEIYRSDQKDASAQRERMLTSMDAQTEALKELRGSIERKMS